MLSTAARIPLVLALLLQPVMASSQEPYKESGYIEMTDGTLLKYTTYRPSEQGAFPVALVYDVYTEGGDPLTIGNNPIMARALLEAGYAVLGVNVRGTGCSGGSWYPISREWGRDGAEVVEWAADQDWSSGRVGMFGLSFPGLSQFATAPFHPRGLSAIAPFQPTTDWYRDVMYPGGIYNHVFMSFWGFGVQPSAAATATREHMHEGPCQQSLLQQTPANQRQNVFVQGAEHPFFDDWWAQSVPDTHAAAIDVPTLGCFTWQDDEVSGRNGSFSWDKLDPAKTWIIASNGYHGQCEFDNELVVDTLVHFFDRFVKGDDNGFEAVPHVQIWHEATRSDGQNAPAWVTTHDSWPVPVEPISLYLRGSGALLTERAGASEAGDSYAYPGPSASTEEGIVFGQADRLWDLPVPSGSWVAYTTPPLAHDMEFFGPASADLWLTATAPDADLQVTLTEVRPDGQEMYVIRGWLRMSHRALEEARSTELLPFHTHRAEDAQQLPLGEPVLGRVEIFPFNHVFRAGSSIRILVEAPTGVTGGWGFDYLKTPSVNTILHDEAHPSRIVFGLVPGGIAQAGMPTCNEVLNQPCRENTIPVPSGSLTIR